MGNSRATFSVWDYDKETGTFSCPGVEIDEVNFVAQNALIAALFLAVGDVSKGQIYKDVRVFDEGLISGTPPGDDTAQRENKWLVRLTEADTWRKLKMEIPCADTGLLDVNSKGQMDKSDAKYIALKAAIEAYYLSDRDKAVTVGDVIFVGRNL